MTAIGLRGLSSGFSTSSSRLTFTERVRRVWAYRRILVLLVRQDISVRYSGSFLGYFWTMLEPLAMIGVYWFVFTQVISRNIGFSPYVLYLATGILLWRWFQSGVPAVARALLSNSAMVRSTNVPREIWVLRVVCSRGLDYVFSIPVIALFALLYRKSPGIGVVYIPLAIVYCFFLLLGFGLLLAVVTVTVRDLTHIIQPLMRMLFYVSPVIYSVKNIPPHLRFAININPAVGMVLLARATFFPQELLWTPVICSAIGIVIILVIGYMTFVRLENRVLKEI